VKQLLERLAEGNPIYQLSQSLRLEA